jgi:hypothetical protein
MNEDIDFSDIPELGDDFFKNAVRIGPLVQKETVLVDRDVYEWFKEHVPESSKLISQLLRNYIDEQKKSSAA